MAKKIDRQKIHDKAVKVVRREWKHLDWGDMDKAQKKDG
jgi:hypothetical protein